MIVEVRIYKTRPGVRDLFLEIFRSRTAPEHDRLGMPITGPFCCVDDADTFFFIRSFKDPETRKALKAEFYEGELWRGELEELLMPMLETYQTVAIDVAEGESGVSHSPWRQIMLAPREQ